MSRPAQLEQQIARVKELQEEMLNGDNTDNSDTPSGDPPAGTPASVVVDEPPATISKDEYNKLEQRYRTLQGMHAAETGRLRADLAARDTQLQAMEDRLAQLERSSKPAAEAPAKYVTDEDVKEYGETIDMVRRAAREEAEAISKAREQALLQELAELKAQVGHVRNTVVPKVEDLSKQQFEQARADFWGSLETHVPDWRAINDNQGFKDWLLSEDPITGATRQQFLAQAQYNLDAPRVIRFFQEWKRTAAGGQTPAPKNSANSELEKLVAPGASKGAGVPSAPEKKQWTRAEISQFYRDVTTGKYANRPEERKKIENDIFLAQKENRVS